jgi:hypothetical protein
VHKHDGEVVDPHFLLVKHANDHCHEFTAVAGPVKAEANLTATDECGQELQEVIVHVRNEPAQCRTRQRLELEPMAEEAIEGVGLQRMTRVTKREGESPWQAEPRLEEST